MATAPGPVLLGRRLAHSLTQGAACAEGRYHAGGHQPDRTGPGLADLRNVSSLLGALGEVPEVTARRAAGSHDARHLADMAARSPEERLELAMSWNKLAGEIALAGRRARVDRGDVIALTEAEVTGRE